MSSSDFDRKNPVNLNSDGAPVLDMNGNPTGLFLRYDPSHENASWMKEKYATVDEWMAKSENQAPGKDPLEAVMPWEKEFIEKSKGSMCVPYHIGNVTEAILTAELRSGGTIDENTSVSKIVAKKVIENGDVKTPEDGRLGVLSCIFRIQVEYEGGSGPTSLIYKTVPLDANFAPLRGLCRGMRAWELECTAYNTKHYYTETPAPKGYFAVYDPVAYRYQVLIEDLNERGMACGDQVKGLNMDQQGSVLTTFEFAAKQHATYWNKTVEKKCVEFAKTFTNPFWPAVFPIMYGQTWSGGLAALPSFNQEMDPWAKEWGDYLAGEGMVAKHVNAMAMSKERGDFLSSTLCHGDFRLDNLFFKYDDKGQVMKKEDGSAEFIAIDWQLVMEINPGWELAYFFAQSVSTEFRQKHEYDCLAHYYKTLIAGGVDKSTFSWNEFLVHYSFGSTFSWYYSTFGGFGAIANGERGLALYKALMNRWISAAKEWEIRPVFDFIIAKMEDPDRRKVPLTEEECLSLLPESKRAWSDPTA